MAKDAAAGGVLIAAVAAAVVGAIVFLPKAWAWLTLS
jgi:diacylglycerol kinase